MSTVTKFVIERSKGIYVSYNGGETKTLKDAKVFNTIDTCIRQMSTNWLPKYFKFEYPHCVINNHQAMCDYAHNIVSNWAIIEVDTSITLSTTNC